MTFQPTAFLEESRRARAAQLRWQTLPLRERLKPIRRLRQLLVERGSDLCRATKGDVNRPESEVLATDLLPFADACDFLRRRAASILKPRKIPWRDTPLWLIGTKASVHRRPWGIVGIIGTWNYPLLLNGVQIVQALTAGNAVLWKPSELTPTVAEQFRALFNDAGYPAELFQVLPATREAGVDLLEADIDHLIFTGSDSVGRKIAVRCAERLLPSTLELSGCDAFIIRADADLALAARALWYGLTLNQGQTCIATRRVFVPMNRQADFEKELEATAQSRPERALLLPSQVRQAGELIREAIAGGARSLLSDWPASEIQGSPTMPAVVLTDATPAMRLCREAIFAPVAAIVPYRDEEELIAIDAVCPFALGATIFSGNSEAAKALAVKIPAGLISINDCIVASAHPALPFGGRNNSGWGTTQGAEGLLAATVPQVVIVRGGKFRPHYDSANGGIDAGTQRLLGGLLKWGHAAGFRRRWSGFWNVIRGAMQTGKKGTP